MKDNGIRQQGTMAGRRRAFDLVLVVLLAPLLVIPALLVALLVFLDSPGPVIFRARRIGIGGRPFDMLKFRTMRNGSDGAPVSASDDPRVTPLGQLLRATRLDELPQVWNVIRGEMSVVGPRPENEEFVAAYRKDYERILAVPPGLTGPSQVRFATAEARMLADSDDPTRHYTEAVLPGKVALDVDYARNHTNRRDLVIIGQTLVLPFRQLGGKLALEFRPHRFGYALSAAIGAVLLLAFALTTGSPS
jgi:lipopolysaccharide/colanic/teichoic acid biosynthesis glycosyltransferase